jgi:hypothetical protein
VIAGRAAWRLCLLQSARLDRLPAYRIGIASMTSSTSPKRNAKSKDRPHDDPEQSRRFLEAAKEAGADETEKGAERAFKAVVKPRKPK